MKHDSHGVTLLPLCVNHTLGSNYEGRENYEIPQKKDEIENKRFLVTNTIAAWNTWSSWSACSHSCGGGFQTRDRMCNTSLNSDCTGHSYDIQDCNAVPCVVDGKWSAWGTYSRCSVTCGNGTRTRNRICILNNPAASHGAACFGANSTTEPCNTGPCPVDGVWSTWSNYTACSKTCGGGVQVRSRTCVFLNGHPHGRDCIGYSSSSQTCHTEVCPAPTKSSFTCVTCGDNPADLCEFVYEQNTVCPEPYCVNIVRNPETGQRLIERKCGSLQECKTDWWQQTSQMEKCTLFNSNFIYTQMFECTYCCTTTNCNTNLHPDTETLYREN